MMTECCHSRLRVGRLLASLWSAPLLAVTACGHGPPAVSASSKATPTAPWPGLPSGPIGAIGASRLMEQGTFGATIDGINAATAQTYADWFGQQVAAPATLQAPLLPQANSDPYVPWWTTVVTAPDQLRQRLSFALSEILVLSDASSALNAQTQNVAVYEDILTGGAFGNFRDLLDTVSHSPTMGLYLSFFKNTDDPSAGVHADENYAREIMQLFTVGLWMLNPDGTQMLDSKGNPIPTYAQADVENLARAFTGWGSAPIPPDTIDTPTAWLYDLDAQSPMVCYPTHHDTTAKTIIGGVSIPAGGTCDSDLKIALDTLFQHPNAGPFLGKQLIERLVTSNPSPAYVGRVAAAFANDGTGARGNLLAVAEAVLTDPEAITAGTAAKLREPIIAFTNLYRAFSAADPSDGKIDEGQVVPQGFNNFAEAPMYSPTVFNFFRPDYQFPGPLTSAGLVAPEFQIANENTVITTLSLFESFSYQFLDSTNQQHSGSYGFSTPINPNGSVLLHTAEWEHFASDAGSLADELNLVFMQGQMPDAMRTAIVDYVTPITSISQSPQAGPAAVAGQRVVEGTFLVVTSPQFAIQR
jgi:uncharacterized protein (DUF1800 family)